MPRTPDQMERIQQPLWDTLIGGTVPGALRPNAAITGGQYVLFGSSNASDISISNMETPGVLPGNQTFLLLAMRVNLYFRNCLDAQPVNVDTDLYHHAVLSLYWQLNIDQKRYFVAPSWYLNAGGGLKGSVGGNPADQYFTNGEPSSAAIMTLDRPIPLVKQQPFQVLANVTTVGTVNLGQDIANLTAGEINIQFICDGLKLRDVL
jgi:hypothetical protein